MHEFDMINHRCKFPIFSNKLSPNYGLTCGPIKRVTMAWHVPVFVPPVNTQAPVVLAAFSNPFRISCKINSWKEGEVGNKLMKSELCHRFCYFFLFLYRFKGSCKINWEKLWHHSYHPNEQQIATGEFEFEPMEKRKETNEIFIYSSSPRLFTSDPSVAP